MAGDWTLHTTIALLTVISAFELQVPLARLLRRRCAEPRLIIWVFIFGISTLAGALYLLLRVPILDRIYAVALGVLLINLLGVYQKEQKSIANELAVFAGLTLALPFAYTTTTGTMIRDLLGLWLLCTLVFSSSIFTMRLRRFGDEFIAQAAAFHITALAILFLLVRIGLLVPALAWTYLLPLSKLVLILFLMDNYRRLRTTTIGFVEASLAILFAIWVGYIIYP